MYYLLSYNQVNITYKQNIVYISDNCYNFMKNIEVINNLLKISIMLLFYYLLLI